MTIIGATLVFSVGKVSVSYAQDNGRSQRRPKPLPIRTTFFKD